MITAASPRRPPDAPITSTARIDILGPLRLTVGGDEVEVRGVRRRALLALLALRPGHIAGVDHVLDTLWPQDSDITAHAVVSLVSRLRGQMGPASSLLERAGGGYRLRAGSWQVDVDDARALAHRARTIAPDDPAAAVPLFEAALDHWRGPALEELHTIEGMADVTTTLRELRLGIEDDLLAALVRVDAGSHVVDRTLEAALREPLREQRRMAHIRALARAGRAHDALNVAADYRRLLAEETGLDPSAAFGELERIVAEGGAGPSGPEPDMESRPDALAVPERWPTYLTAMHGRDADAARLRALLERERLVTVAGSGGMGKTRLVAAVVDDFARVEGRSVVYVALAGIDAPADPTAVVGALAGAIGLRSGSEQPPLAACAEWLASDERLLVLDNCEHVLGPVRDLITDLSPADGLRIVLTSRVPTGLPGEAVLRLRPLPRCRDAGEERSAHPAVQIFLDRARRVADVDPSDVDLDAVAEIVDRLDGVPLAIELAAGRLTTLRVRELATHLDSALDLLADGRPTIDARHRSLRATLDWSYRLLSADERRLLLHLAAFADGTDLTGVEAVATTLQLPAGGIPALAQLVDASMVEVDRSEPVRYRLLEAVRDFASDRHRQHGGDRSPSRTVVRWAVEAASEIEATARGSREAVADRRLRREFTNLRSARAAAVADGELDAALGLTLALDRPASFRDLPEVWTWASELVAHEGLAGHPRRPAALGAAAQAAWLTGELDTAERLALRGLRLDPASGRCSYALATVRLFRGDTAVAHDLFLTAAEQDPQALANAALAATYGGDIAAAVSLIGGGLRWAEQHGGPTDVAVFHYATGELRERPLDAAASYRTSIDLARRSGATFVEGVATVGLASALVDLGEDLAALDAYRRLIIYWSRTGNWTQQWTTLRNVAQLLDARGRALAAATIRASAAGAVQAATVLQRDATEPVPADVLPRTAVVQLALDSITAELS